MKKFAMALAAALIAVAVGAGLLWSQLGSERSQLAALQARVANMEKTQQAAAALPPPNAAAAQTAPIATAEAASAAPRGKDLAKGVAAALSKPEVLRGILEQQFQDVAKELGLSPAEAEKFYALLARQTAGSVSSALGMFAGNSDSAARQESVRKLLQTSLAADKEMSTLLGSRRHQQWQEYQGTVAARQQVEQLRYMLGSGDNALSEAKTKPLIAALGSETARTNRDTQSKLAADMNSSRNLLDDQLKYADEGNQRLVGAASLYLSAAQLERYKQMLEQQQALARALMGPDGQGNSPAGTGAQR